MGAPNCVMEVKLRTVEGELFKELDADSPLYPAVREALGLEEDAHLVITFGGEPIEDDGSTLADNGVFENGTLAVHQDAMKDWSDPVTEPYPGEDEIRARFLQVTKDMDLDGDGLINGDETVRFFKRVMGP